MIIVAIKMTKKIGFQTEQQSLFGIILVYLPCHQTQFNKLCFSDFFNWSEQIDTENSLIFQHSLINATKTFHFVSVSFQSNFTPELYYLCLSFGIFAVLSTGRYFIYQAHKIYVSKKSHQVPPFVSLPLCSAVKFYRNS